MEEKQPQATSFPKAPFVHFFFFFFIFCFFFMKEGRREDKGGRFEMKDVKKITLTDSGWSEWKEEDRRRRKKKERGEKNK